jgi:hypothetical protein
MKPIASRAVGVNTRNENQKMSVCPPPPQSTANEILEAASNLQERAHRIANFTSDRLYPVMGADPECDLDKLGTPSRSFPPMFETLRGHLESMNNALDRIERSVSRTEL